MNDAILDIDKLLAWHNTKDSIALTRENVHAKFVSIPFWRASGQVRYRYRYRIGQRNLLAEVLAEQRYASDLLRYQATMTDIREGEKNANKFSAGFLTAAKIHTFANQPTAPDPAQSAVFHWSDNLVAVRPLDKLVALFKPTQLYPMARAKLLGWAEQHAFESSALPSLTSAEAVERIEADQGALPPLVDRHITQLAMPAIQADIIARRDDVATAPEHLGTEFDTPPGIEHRHVWRVTLEKDNRRVMFLVGKDGARFAENKLCTKQTAFIGFLCWLVMLALPGWGLWRWLVQ